MAKTNFLFITANKNERMAFLEKLQNQKEKTYNGGIVITYGRFGEYDVAHFHSPYQGNEAQMSILNALRASSPAAVVLVGIACGSNIKKQKYGDVLISKNVIDYDFNKARNGKIEPRGVMVPSGNELFSLFSQRAYYWEEQNHIGYHCGDIICSDVLLDDSQKKKEIFELYYNHPIGYEMEGMGVFRVCRNYDIQQWIVVKGISDFGDGNKEDENKNQILAAKNAVSLCYYVFSHNGLESLTRVSNDVEGENIMKHEQKREGTYNIQITQIHGDNFSGNAQKLVRLGKQT